MFKFHLFFFTILLLKYYSLETEPVFYSIKLESTLFIMVNTMFCEKSFSEMKSSKVYDNNDDVRQGKALASASLQHKQQWRRQRTLNQKTSLEVSASVI